jgi:hypothetical protein
VTLVRDGSARHRNPLVLCGHERSRPASENGRSQAIHRYDHERRSSIGQGSNPSANRCCWIALGSQRVGTSDHQLADTQVRALVGRLPQVNGLPSRALRHRFKVVPNFLGVLTYEAQTTYERDR